MAEWVYVIRSSERELFKRCRRAWDLGSRERKNYQPISPSSVFDFERAIHDALAVYYFPGMWEWNREIVLPLALEGFFKSMHRQRDRYLKEREMTALQESDWDDHLKLGRDLLERYFKWAPTIDRFSTIQVETEFEANIPDHRNPDQDLTVPGDVPGHMMPVHYRGRIDLLILDKNNSYWLVDHRVVEDTWEELDRLILDERNISFC